MRGPRSRFFLCAAVLLGGCAAGPVDSSDPSPLAADPSATASSSEAAVPGSPAELLDCDGPASAMGGFADDFGPEGAGGTADEAFEEWATTTVFPVPRSGYERLGGIGDRSVYAYAVDDRIKVVVVISPRFSEHVGGAPFTIEELRTCDPSEYGAAVDLGPDRRVWANAETGKILEDIAGPGHCGWESARMLHMSNAEGTLAKQYLRDPLGVFADVPGLLGDYAEGLELPQDATFSGYVTADGLELWFAPDDRAAYIVTPDGVERWPRAEPPIGCA